MADHHFVPQFYLRGFRDPLSLGAMPKDQWLWVADRARGEVKARAPRNVGARTNYNALPEAQGHESAEQVLSQLESVAAPIIRSLNNGVSRLPGQERVDLLFFAAFLGVRTPFFRDQMEGFAAGILEDLLQQTASHPEYYHAGVRATATVELTDEEIEASRLRALTPGAFKIQVRPLLSLFAAFEGANRAVYPHFNAMRWAILRTDPGLFFVTSDNPVSWADMSPRPPFYEGHGLRMRNVEVVFPVGPEVCMLGTWNGPTGALRAQKRLVDAINLRVARFAVSEIYAHREGLARHVMAEHRKRWVPAKQAEGSRRPRLPDDRDQEARGAT